jgi:hypothetical protein
MSNEEFDELLAQRNHQLTVESAMVSGDDHINSDAPIPPLELIVNSTVTTGDKAGSCKYDIKDT